MATDDPTLSDVLPTDEQAIPDHREHAKMPVHPNDDALAARTEHEREAVHSDDSPTE